LDEFHLSVEALGDAVVFGEGPHAGGRFGPGFEGISEGDKGLKATSFELVK
jgi:hypothetical protein